MNFKQEIEKAYQKWTSEEQKYKITPKTHEWLYSKMATLKKDLDAFADKFDRNFVNAKDLTGKDAEEIRKSIKDDFVDKIEEVKDWGKYTPIVTPSEPGSKYYQSEKSRCDRMKNELKQVLGQGFGGLTTDLQNSNSLVDFFDIASKRIGRIRIPQDMPLYKNFNEWRPLCNFFKYLFDTLYDIVTHVDEMVLNDKDYFYDETDYNVFSRLCRWMWPEYWALKVNYDKQKQKCTYDKHTIEPVPDSVKIFPTATSPSPREVKQGYIGDCGLQATLIGLAKFNPDAIKNCFVQGLDKIENEENIKIRVFRYARNGSMVPMIVTVNRKKVLNPTSIRGGALWPKLIEKALAALKIDITGINSLQCLSALTGNITIDVSNALTRVLWLQNTDCIKLINHYLSQKQAITCTFKDDFKINDAKCGETIQIYKNHAYAIVGADKTKGYVRLINPWKSGGRSVENSPKSKEGGHIAMELNNFKQHLETIN